MLLIFILFESRISENEDGGIRCSAEFILWIKAEHFNNYRTQKRDYRDWCGCVLRLEQAVRMAA